MNIKEDLSSHLLCTFALYMWLYILPKSTNDVSPPSRLCPSEGLVMRGVEGLEMRGVEGLVMRGVKRLVIKGATSRFLIVAGPCVGDQAQSTYGSPPMFSSAQVV